MRARPFVTAAIPVMLLIYLASPFAALWRLSHALDRGDTLALERRVDWVAVRDGLKQDIAEGVIGLVEASAPADSLPPFGASFVTGLASTAVEREVTPQNLVAVIQQMHPKTAPSTSLRSFDWAFFDSPTSFSVVLRPSAEDDGHLRVRLELRGGTWMVVRAWIPQEMVERAAQRT